MAKGVNKVILVGNLGQAPEVAEAAGSTVCNMRLATNESYKNKSGEWVDKAEWHDVVAWGRLAEICGDYLEKGSQVYFEGKLQTRKWEDRDGNTRYSTEVRVFEMMMLDSNRQSGSSSGGSSSGQKSPPRSSASNKPTAQAVPKNDDLPF